MVITDELPPPELHTWPSRTRRAASARPPSPCSSVRRCRVAIASWWSTSTGSNRRCGGPRTCVTAPVRLRRQSEPEGAHRAARAAAPSTTSSSSTPREVSTTPPIVETVLDAADFVIVPLTPEPLAVDPTMRTITRLVEPRHLPHAVLLNRIDRRVPNQLQRGRNCSTPPGACPDSTPTCGSSRPTRMLRSSAHLSRRPRQSAHRLARIADVTRVGHEMPKHSRR